MPMIGTSRIWRRQAPDGPRNREPGSAGIGRGETRRTLTQQEHSDVHANEGWPETHGEVGKAAQGPGNLLGFREAARGQTRCRIVQGLSEGRRPHRAAWRQGTPRAPRLRTERESE